MPRRDRPYTARSSPFLSEDFDGIPAHDPIASDLDEHESYSNTGSDVSRAGSHEEITVPKLEAKPKKEQPSFPNPKYVPNNKPYIILYHVSCSCAESHSDHESLAVYLDHPRLYKGDSKMSALRGQVKVADLSKYIERHSKNINFIVTKRFDCFQYCNLDPVQKLFHRLPLPDDPEVPDSIRPYFFSLRTNSPPAYPSTETMEILSESLKDAMVAVTGMSRDDILNLGNATNMNMLQNSIYYYSHIKERTFGALDSKEIRHLNDLLDYMQLTNKLDWGEADALISGGLITQEHMAKLYGFNQVLVTTENGHDRAYMLTRPPNPGIKQSLRSDSKYKRPITLDLWSWQFNGSFYRMHEDWSLAWPSSAPTDEPILISQLEIYPLRFASSEVVDRLKARGRIFWKCRHARFVAYTPPNAILELHTVSSLVLRRQ